MTYDFRDLRKVPTYPTYPPYHKGEYLEEHAFSYMKANRDVFEGSGRTMIPVSWTTLYVENHNINIQAYLNALPRDGKYWTISQHDDGIRQQLPPDTLHFAAGGNGGGIPIPLICSEIPKELIEKAWGTDKDLFCTFVGSMTHPIRESLFKNLYKNDNFAFNPPRPWSQTVSPNDLLSFIQSVKRSEFSLAPRGYGKSSFRLYEIMQLGNIPVYVSDEHWLPWQDELNWNDFCVIIKPDEIPDLPNILSSYSDTRKMFMREVIREIYPKYFTLKGVCDNILKRL